MLLISYVLITLLVLVSCSCKMFFSLVGVLFFLYILFYVICSAIFDCDVTLGLAEKFGKSIGVLRGKVVFITGASSGIGESLAIALSQFGVKLVLAARRQEELERVKTLCLTKSNGLLSPADVLVMPMDMLNIDLHQAYFDEALRYFGRIDILVNNAGRSQRAFWENVDMKVDKEMFELNVFSVVSLTRIALKYFLEKNAGHVAVTSSLAGVIGVPYSCSYTGAKHAIHGYFDSLRNEKMSNHISVSVFCPGPTATPYLSSCFTGSPGQVYGMDVTPKDKRLTSERCGYLCAVALANKLRESWMGVFPIIPFSYIAVYFPNLYHWILKLVGPNKFFKLRDSKDPTDIEVTK